jgi:hypothetical protein
MFAASLLSELVYVHDSMNHEQMLSRQAVSPTFVRCLPLVQAQHSIVPSLRYYLKIASRRSESPTILFEVGD